MLVNANTLCIPLAGKSVQVCVTSPPYYSLRDYSQCECVKFISSDIASSTLNGGGNVHLSSHSQKKSADPDCPYCRGTGRDERMAGQLGLEATPEAYIANLVAVGRELWRVLRDDGTFWLNLGDTYCANRTIQVSDSSVNGNRSAGISSKVPDGLKPKDLMMIPARVALALQADGWWLRAEIVWAKPNPMPESVTDRPTRSHEMIYLLTKNKTYYYDNESVKETATGYDGRKDTRMKGSPKYANGFVPEQSVQSVAIRGHERWQKRKNDDTDHGGNGSGFQDHSGYSNLENPYVRNQRDVWTLATEPCSGTHYATFPTEIPRRAILAGTSAKGHCAKCGKGWVRVIERRLQHIRPNQDILKDDANKKGLIAATSRTRTALDRVDQEQKNPGYDTLGWQPACKCNAEVIPAIILDPFCGSGTVGEVCRELGQRFVGLDLSMKYLRENAMPRAERSQTPESISRLSLFGGNGDEQLSLKQDATGNLTYTGFNARWKETHSD